MSTLPLPVRVAAGLVVTAVEQVRELPRLVTELPITAVSQALQASMRAQQRVTELAIKGDRALSLLRPVPEKPEWAVFDDELDEEPSANGRPGGPAGPRTGAEPATPEEYDELLEAAPAPDVPAPGPDAPGYAGRGPDSTDEAEPDEPGDAGFAPDEPDDAGPGPEAHGYAEPEPEPAPVAQDEPPAVLPEYPRMSLPQLRGKLRTLSLGDLQALLMWETSHGNRPPYVTMLSNRITTVSEA